MAAMVTQNDYDEFYHDIMEYVSFGIPDEEQLNLESVISFLKKHERRIKKYYFAPPQFKNCSSDKNWLRFIDHHSSHSEYNHSSISLSEFKYGSLIDDSFKEVVLDSMRKNDTSKLEELKRNIAFFIREMIYKEEKGTMVTQKQYEKFYEDIMEYVRGKTYNGLAARFAPTIGAVIGSLIVPDPEPLESKLCSLLNSKKISLNEREYGRFIDENYKTMIIKAMRNKKKFDKDDIERLKFQIASKIIENFGIK